MADLATMTDKVEMNIIIHRRIEKCCKVTVCLLGGNVVGTQAQAPCQAVDMCVYGESRFAEREEQHNSRGLWTDALEMKQPFLRFFKRQILFPI